MSAGVGAVLRVGWFGAGAIVIVCGLALGVARRSMARGAAAAAICDLLPTGAFVSRAGGTGAASALGEGGGVDFG
jgi:hypothetical protein